MGVINVISYTQLYGNPDNYMDDDYKAECLNPSFKFTIPLPCHQNLADNSGIAVYKQQINLRFFELNVLVVNADHFI